MRSEHGKTDTEPLPISGVKYPWQGQPKLQVPATVLPRPAPGRGGAALYPPRRRADLASNFVLSPVHCLKRASTGTAVARSCPACCQLPEPERIGVVGGDGAYVTRRVYKAITSRRADLVVPPRRNGKSWKRRTAGAVERNEPLRAIRHLGQRLWKRWSGSHRRSLARHGYVTHQAPRRVPLGPIPYRSGRWTSPRNSAPSAMDPGPHPWGREAPAAGWETGPGSSSGGLRSAWGRLAAACGEGRAKSALHGHLFSKRMTCQSWTTEKRPVPPHWKASVLRGNDHGAEHGRQTRPTRRAVPRHRAVHGRPRGDSPPGRLALSSGRRVRAASGR
jgi:hypothetical protein